MSCFNPYPDWAPQNIKLPVAPIQKERAFDKAAVPGLNDQQLKAVLFLTGRRQAIFSGAGSGKSFCLVEKMKNIVETDSAARVLMISFTKKAAAELKNRVGNMPNVQISTFHSLAYGLLKAEGSFNGFKVVTDAAVQEAIISILIGPKDDTTKEEVVESLHTAKAATKATLAIKEKFLRYLLQKKLLTFDAIPVFALIALRSNRAFLRRYQKAYQYILIDEFQDADQVLVELVELLGAESKQICVAGDVRQAIYEWRGSDFRILPTFMETAAVHELNLNYRCNSAILGLANAVMKEYPPLISATNAAPVYPQYCTADTEAEEASCVADQITELHKKGHAYKDMAVLFRSTASAKHVFAELLARKIPVITKTQISLPYTSMPQEGIIKLFRLIYDPTDKAVRDILPILYLKQGDWKKIQGLAKAEKCTVLEAVKKLPLPFFHAEYVKAMIDAIVYCQQRQLSPYDAMEKLCKAGYSKFAGDLAPVLTVMKDELVKFPTIMELLAHLDELADRAVAIRKLMEDNPDSVQLLSIHSSKGMEFRDVFILGVYEGNIPNGRTVDIAEEKRILYVAITRCREFLFLSYPVHSMNDPDHRNEASRFLRDVFFDAEK